MKKEVEAIHSKIEKFLQTNNVVPDADDSDENPESSCESNEEVECRCDWKDEELILKEIELIEKQTDSLEKWKSKFVIKFIKKLL